MPVGIQDLLKLQQQQTAAANTPLLPEMGQHLDDPALDRSPLEASLRGFGAGALQGLRGLSTPANIASNLAAVLPTGGGAFKGLRSAAPVAEEIAGGGDLMRATRTALWGGDSMMPGNGPIEALSSALPGGATAAGPVVRGVATPSGITPEMSQAVQAYMRKGW